ncbi:protein kinase domain-containing protein [Actinophytocola xanthii]|uniref:protein kinase domain-containing protein n=1 Tax=Actinophytocola xanthii TaxID=1912961 RepID=UPI0011774FA8|nr:protein kinase [Actinophytocola xanthii]
MEPGDLIGERYRIVSLVGRGAMGVVWKAHDTRLDRQVAVKQLRLDRTKPAEAEEATQRAMREGRNAGRLRHQNAVAVYDVVEHESSPCLVMEFLNGESLADRGVGSPREAAAIGAQLAAALAAAHEAGIVHRDVKPDNVLITADGTAKITDFGISRAAGDVSVTATGILAGTPAYLAPEVARGDDADFRSDVFSLGATLYAVLEGMPPFGIHENAIAMLHRVAAGKLNPPRNAGVLTGPLLWLLNPDPAQRPTMHAAHEVLAAAARGRPTNIPAGPNPTLTMPRRRMSRRAVVAAVLAAALVAAGVVVGILIAGDDEPSGGDAGGGSSGAPPPASSSTAPPRATCLATFRVTNSWQEGYGAEVTVTNQGDTTLTGWRLTWTLPDGQQIKNLWNGQRVQEGNAVTVDNAPYNVSIEPGAEVKVGMNIDTVAQARPVPEIRCEER